MIEATDIVSYLSMAFSAIVAYLWKEDRANMKEVYSHYLSSKEDHKSIEDIKMKSNQAYLEFALSNERLVGEIRKLDSDVRHEVANLRTSINGFGARLVVIEEDVKERTRENENLEKRLDVVEKALKINP